MNMSKPDRLAEADKQLRIFVEQNSNEPYSDELKQIINRLDEVREDLRDSNRQGVQR
jgi:hypothetical protein